jgi:hypothetical protein
MHNSAQNQMFYLVEEKESSYIYYYKRIEKGSSLWPNNLYSGKQVQDHKLEHLIWAGQTSKERWREISNDA